MADPTRAPGIREHRGGYRLQPILTPAQAAALADRWETTGELPSAAVRRYVGEGIERDRRRMENAGLQGKVQRARAGLARQPVACCPNIECMEPVSDASRSTCAFCGAALARQEDPK